MDKFLFLECYRERGNRVVVKEDEKIKIINGVCVIGIVEMHPSNYFIHRIQIAQQYRFFPIQRYLFLSTKIDYIRKYQDTKILYVNSRVRPF